MDSPALATDRPVDDDLPEVRTGEAGHPIRPSAARPLVFRLKKPSDVESVLADAERACLLLRQARDLLINAPRAQAKARLALKSAEGAVRHAHGRVIRSQR
jgi:hypothetical protein